MLLGVGGGRSVNFSSLHDSSTKVNIPLLSFENPRPLLPIVIAFGNKDFDYADVV